MKLLAATLLFILSLPLQCSCAVSSIGCDATEPMARKALDLINKGRWDGYLFQLLRVADAHLDQAEFGAVYYLVLDVKESDCSVLSRKHWDDCEPALSRRPSDTVIGQCKVIATTRLLGSPNLRVKDFNCTTSSVSSALTNTKDSPVLLDFFEDTELYRKQADKALEKYKRENGDFASFKVDKVKRVIRAVFGFCRADLFYDVEDSNLETPKDIVINCEVFNLEEHRNISDMKHRLGHRLHSGEHEHSPAGRPPFKPDGSRDHHHPQHSHNFRCPPPLEDKSHLNSPTLQAGAPPPLPPPGSKGLHPCSITKGARGPPNNHIAGEHHPHTHHLHRQHPHGHHPQGHHPHDHDFYHHGPCDPPPHSQGPQDHHRRGHGPPPRHSEEGGPSKGHFPFHWWQIGYVHRLPPLKKDEVLPLPEANFPRISLPHPHNPLLLEIQAFPQSKSESCPGAFNSKFPHITKFFANAVPK